MDQKTELSKAVFDKIAGNKKPIIKEEGDKLVMRELPYYHMVAEKDVADGVAYESEGKSLQLKIAKMEWDTGLPFKSAPSKVDVTKPTGDLGILIEGRPGNDAVGVRYPDAFGLGVHVGVLTHKYKMKIVKSIDSQPVIPKSAKTLDIWTELSGDLPLDWNSKDAEITEPVKLGEDSRLNPAWAWDSQSEWVEDEGPGSGYYKQNRIPIKSFLRVVDGKSYHIKSMPADWLETAQYPIYTDVDITWGAGSDFTTSATRATRMCRVKGSTTKFAVGYSLSDVLHVRVGEYSAPTTIAWGADSGAIVTLNRNDAFDVCSPSDDIIAVSYNDSNADWQVRAGDLTGTAINGWGAEVTINSGGATDYAYHVDVAPGDTDEFVAFNSDRGISNQLYACHCTLSGAPKTTITNNDMSLVVNTEFFLPHAAQIDTNKWLVAGYHSSNTDGEVVAISWDGVTPWNVGAVVTFETDADHATPYGAGSPFIDFGSTDKAVVTFRDYTGTDRSRAFAVTVSTLTCTLGAIVNLGDGYANQNGVAFTSETDVIFLFVDQGNSDKLYSNKASVVWATRVITLGTSEEVDSNTCKESDIVYLQSGVVAGAYGDTTNTDGTGIIGTYAAPVAGVLAPYYYTNLLAGRGF